jgi:predicted HicB family RNase H-like nuclease
MTDNNTMKYKGYTALVEFSDEDRCLIRRVLGIRDAIVFDGSTVEETRSNFQGMIDHYIEACAKSGRGPNQPVSEVMVPISPALYAKASGKAEHDGIPVRQLMEAAIEKFVGHRS